jgi:ApeA N-terminal domain 1
VTVLEERGVFWWHHEPIPENCFAPQSSVPGLLKISDDGAITLDLDGYFPSDKGAWSVLPDMGECKGKIIEGILRATDRRVILLDLAPYGGRFATSGLSYSGYQAAHCLVSEPQLPERIAEFSFQELDMDLAGLEGWLRLGSSEVSATSSTISVKHRKRDDIVYNVEGGKIALKFHVQGSGLSHGGKSTGLSDGRKSYVEIRDKASLIYMPSSPLGLTDMQMKFLWFDDLFTILTDSEYNLTWPYLVRSDQNQTRYSWFFLRSLSRRKAPEWYETPTNFVQLQGGFEAIVSAWLKKRDEFGPGFYLYLGTRRGMQIYVEHLFASLVWGIEALHRRKETEDPKAAEIKERVSRILAKIDDCRDKKWLARELRHAHEPTLAERIFQVLISVPIEGIDRKPMRAFAEKCAALRNDISHFGSHRHGGSYDEFLRELSKHSEALSKLYHALILHEIGIDAQIINDWLYKGFHSHRMRSALVEVGLLDASVLKPPTIKTSS